MGGHIQDWLDAIALLGVALATVGGWLKFIRPRIRRARSKVTASFDAILGREEVRDSITGQVVQPALPGIGVRMASVEEAQVHLASAVATLVESQAATNKLTGRVDHVEALIADHADRIGRLESAAVERITSKVESTAAWSAVEAVAKTKEN